MPKKTSLSLGLGFIFLFWANTLSGQDWKTAYDLAVTHYQSQQYNEALAEAHKAYTASKSLDAKNQAYSLQLLTVICLESNQPAEGLKWVDEEAALFLKSEGIKSKTYSEALRKHALLLQQAGRLKEAETKCTEALNAIHESEGKSSLSYASLNAFYGQLLTVNGDLPRAKEILNQSLEQLSLFPEAGEDYISTLSLSANLDKKINDIPSAEAKFKKLVALLEQNNLTQLPEYGAAKSMLADIALAKGQTAESEKLLQGDGIGADQKAQQLLKIAIDYHNSGELERATENYQLAAKAASEASLENNTSFSIHFNLAKVLAERGRLTDATAELALAEQLAKKLFAPSSAENALVLFSLGDLLLKQNQVNEAISAYQKAQALSGKLTPSVQARYLMNASRKLLNSNKSDVAVMLLQPFVSSSVNSMGDKDMIDATLTYCESLILSNQSDLAISQLSKSIVAAPSLEVKNRFEMELAEALQSKGEWKKALQLLQAIDLTPTLTGELRASNSYQMARLHQQLGNFTESEKNYRISISQYKQLQPARPAELLQVYNSLAILYMQLGNYGEAERAYLELLSQTDPSSDLHTTVQQNLAGVYQETLRYEDAQKLLETVLEKDKTRVGDHHADYAISLQNLAAVYQKTNQLRKAQDLYTQALRIDKENGADQTIVYATKAANLGVVYQEMGDLAQAQLLYEQSLKIRESKLGKDHPDYVFNEYNLAVLHQQNGDWQKALPLFQHVAAFYLIQIRELFPAMSEKEKTAFYNKISEVILAYQDFAIENGARQKELLGELFNFRLATKALLLNASTKVRNRILSSGDAVLLQRFAEWLQTKEELGKLYTLPVDEKEQSKARMSVLQQKANELEKQLSAQSELFARDNNNEIIDWQKVKAHLKPGEAAVEMIRLRLNLKNDSIIYAALVVKPESVQPELILFPDGKKMEGREFSYYRNSVRFQIANERSYAVFWKPLEELLKGSSVIYFSADGVFNKVNVMTLYNPQRQQYLIEQFSIKLVSNLRELVNPKKTSAVLPTAALYGFPDYTLGSAISLSSLPAQTTRQMNPTVRAIVGSGIPALPGTKDEVNKIGDILRSNKWAASLFIGPDATEGSIKAQQNTGVLHIATHGFFVKSTDEEQPVVLTQDLTQAENNPLLRSGLILSGAEKYLLEPQKEKPKEDGILTAYEAINLNLDKTDLVILSACETGAGEIRNGEGVYGLQRAFLLAGANNLVMSLWKVDDEATQELMVEFYSQWNKTKDKNLAFRNTQLEIKKKYASPYYWGSFIMIGSN